VYTEFLSENPSIEHSLGFWPPSRFSDARHSEALLRRTLDVASNGFDRSEASNWYRGTRDRHPGPGPLPGGLAATRAHGVTFGNVRPTLRRKRPEVWFPSAMWVAGPVPVQNWGTGSTQISPRRWWGWSWLRARVNERNENSYSCHSGRCNFLPSFAGTVRVERRYGLTTTTISRFRRPRAPQGRIHSFGRSRLSDSLEFSRSRPVVCRKLPSFECSQTPALTGRIGGPVLSSCAETRSSLSRGFWFSGKQFLDSACHRPAFCGHDFLVQRVDRYAISLGRSMLFARESIWCVVCYHLQYLHERRLHGAWRAPFEPRTPASRRDTWARKPLAGAIEYSRGVVGAGRHPNCRLRFLDAWLVATSPRPEFCDVCFCS